MMTTQAEIKEFIRLKCDSTNIDRFPGPQPVSIEKKHITMLSRTPYLVCEKTDGVRHFLVCFTDSQNRKICALVNRSFEFELFPLTVPRDTLLDGELLGTEFIVHDAICIQGEDVRQMSLTDRLKCVKSLARTIIPIQKLRVSCKNMIPYTDMKNLKLSEHNDGVIFTPVNEHVRMGTHRTLFKWKPRDKITIDFYMDAHGVLHIQNESKLTPVYRLESPPSAAPGIVECSYDGTKWVHEKIRTDKSHPNNKRTFDRTMVNIRENIELCDLVPVQRWADED